MSDAPRSLGERRTRSERRAMLRVGKVLRLTELVESIRQAENLVQEVPYFDPADGGTEARCLFLLEAPGPRAVLSGFVSRDNPDKTAENFSKFLTDAGIDRFDTVIWNIVPWYVDNGALTPDDVDKGLGYLRKLLGLLRNLRAVVLVGRTARRALETIRQKAPAVEIFECPHPSPMFVNRHPDNPERIREAPVKVSRFLREG